MIVTPFFRGHRFKRKRHAGLSHSIRSEVRHCLKFCFASSAEAVNVANEPRASRKAAPKDLIDEML
jgi:hypothetical protein